MTDVTFDLISVEVTNPSPAIVGTGLMYMEAADFIDVRDVLGVTELDVPDVLINTRPFALQAEQMVQLEIEDMAAQYADILTKPIVKLALIYCTAALLAEQYGKGGLVSNTRPEGQNRNIDADAKLLWSYYNRYLTQLQASDTAETVQPELVPQVRVVTHRAHRERHLTHRLARRLPWQF